MIGALAAGLERSCLWAGMAGFPKLLWRFDLDSKTFVEENVGNLIGGYSYIHRSIVPAPDGHVYAAATWILGLEPGAGKPKPFSPGGFASAIGKLQQIGAAISSHRIIRSR